ncbi:MAG: DJ-1/PfpI family protein [Actinophytocola sp.]|uniref:DJ-1/PfpI family protein n=1 Tax=Actinophytocola sp. TaxID=1872138 RepID=UPI003C73FCDD
MKRRDLLRSTMGAATAAAVAGLVGPSTVAAAQAAGQRRPDTLRVRILMYDGVEEVDSIGPAEVFDIARVYFDAKIDVKYVTVDEPRVIPMNRGAKMVVEHRWRSRDADIVIVPGGGWRDPEAPGTHVEIARGVIPRAIAEAHDGRRIIAGVCVGVMLMSAAGLTKDRPCTTHALAKERLEAEGGILKTARVVDAGTVVTAGGVTSGIDEALWLVEREFGPDMAVGVERTLEYERRGTVWRA